MPSLQVENVLVRRRKTGRIDIHQANALSGHSRPPSPEHILHYIGADRSRVCRCTNRSKHFERTIEVASEATHLNASLMMYLTRHGFESCSIVAFRKYTENRKAMWLKQGVDIDTFHYMSDAKNMVCRCSRPAGHNSGAPRNPEIIEQCVQFFITHKDAMICRKIQWQGAEGDSPPLVCHSTPSPIQPELMSSPSLHRSPYSHNSPRNAFEYDSQSTQEKDRATRTAASRKMKVRSTAEPITPMYSRYPPTGVFDEPDIPQMVWQSARPSVLVPPYGSDSVVTTPLGTAIPHYSASATPATQLKGPEPIGAAQRDSVTTNWSNIQHVAEVLHEDSSRTRRASSIYTVQRPDSQANDYAYRPEHGQKNVELAGMSPRDSEAGIDISCPQRYELSTHMQEFGANNISFKLRATSVSELPGQVAAVELGTGAQHPNMMHKNQDPRTYAELPGKQSSLEAPHTLPHMRTSMKASPRLSLLFEQTHDTVRLPDQKELLLRHASLVDPPPAGDCTVCDERYQHRQKRTIMLPDCEHSIHEECLLESFRVRDQRVGTCPICNTGLCERTLADRIATDRLAIFGSQFTRLRNQVGIDFPQHNEVVTCASEEEVAAAQLRLIKDYVDVHSEEIFRMWELNCAEPDWFMGIIRPVARLFQAWDVPGRESRYFVNHEVFLKLLAWAELVRLMNHGRKALLTTHGEDANYPQLAELHRKFALALKRYDKEKVLWGEDQGRIPDCDLVAQDVIELAMRTQSA